MSDPFAALWREHRAFVVDLAFRTLGDIASAEDVAQEVFIRLAHDGVDEVDNVRGWLTVVTGRLCLDLLRSAWVRREQPGDPVLLDTVVSQAGFDPADRVTLDDHVQSALVTVLQRLNPPERVAFILHDVFAVPFDEVAVTLGRPVGSCRQLARRARLKIAASDRVQSRAIAGAHRAVLDRFIAACAHGDLDALLTVLHPDAWGSATFVAGSLGTVDLVHGAAGVAANMLRYFGPDATLVSHPMPPTVALLAYRNRAMYGMLVLRVDGDRVAGIEATVDPTV